MTLSQKIQKLLIKLCDPDFTSSAEKEIKTLIVNEIDDGEKLMILVNCISDDKDSISIKSKKLRQAQLKLLITISEIFQYQIIEFLPSIFQTLSSKLRDSEQELADTIAETLGGIFEYAFKDAPQEDIEKSFDVIFQLFFHNFTQQSRQTQMAIGLSLIKVIQNLPVLAFQSKFDQTFTKLEKILMDSSPRSPLQLLESILSLILGLKENIKKLADQLISISLRYIPSEDSKVKKTCLDIINTIFVAEKGITVKEENALLEAISALKTDKNKIVRESAVECLELINSKTSQKNFKKQSEKILVKNEPVRSLTPKKRNSLTPEVQPNHKVLDESLSKQAKKIKPKVQIYNLKIDFSNIHSTIDKKLINKEFVKAKGKSDENIVIFKEPKTKIDYDKIVQKESKNLNNFSTDRQNSEENKQNRMQMNASLKQSRSKDEQEFDNVYIPQRSAFSFEEKTAREYRPSPESMRNLKESDNAINPIIENVDSEQRSLKPQPVRKMYQTQPINESINEHIHSNQSGKDKKNDTINNPFEQEKWTRGNNDYFKIMMQNMNYMTKRIADLEGIVMTLQNNNSLLTNKVLVLEQKLNTNDSFEAKYHRMYANPTICPQHSRDFAHDYSQNRDVRNHEAKSQRTMYENYKNFYNYQQ